MISLASFQSIARHAINMLSGIYLAAVLSYFIGKLIPAAQLVTFIVLSIAWILMGMSVMLHELRYKQDSLITVSIQILPLSSFSSPSLCSWRALLRGMSRLRLSVRLSAS